MAVFVLFGILAASYNVLYAVHSYKSKRPASGAGAAVLAGGCFAVTVWLYLLLR